MDAVADFRCRVEVEGPADGAEVLVVGDLAAHGDAIVAGNAAIRQQRRRGQARPQRKAGWMRIAAGDAQRERLGDEAHPRCCLRKTWSPDAGPHAERGRSPDRLRQETATAERIGRQILVAGQVTNPVGDGWHAGLRDRVRSLPVWRAVGIRGVVWRPPNRSRRTAPARPNFDGAALPDRAGGRGFSPDREAPGASRRCLDADSSVVSQK